MYSIKCQLPYHTYDAITAYQFSNTEGHENASWFNILISRRNIVVNQYKYSSPERFINDALWFYTGR